MTDLSLTTRPGLPEALTVLLAERHEVPVVQATLLVDAGYSADAGVAPGTAKMIRTPKS